MNRFRFQLFLWPVFLLTLAGVDASIYYSYWGSAPSTADSGTSYYIEAAAEFDYEGGLDLYRNSDYVTGSSSYWSVRVGENFTDTGAQTVSYRADIYDYSGNYDWLYHDIQILPAGQPVATVVVDGYGSGATITRPRGGSVTITVRYRATDPDGNLTGIRPQIWMPSGDLDNNGGAFVAQSGTSGEVVRTVTLNANGNWRFWTDAQDAPLAAVGSYVNSGAWNSAFLIVVNEDSGPPPSASVSVDGYANGSSIVWYDGAPAPTVSVRYRGADPDGNLTGIRPQIWTEWTEEGYDYEGNWYSYTNSYFDNNGGQYVSQSGSSGEVVRTWTLDRDTTWYFWSNAIDSVGQTATSGDWGSGFQLTVVRQPSYPSLAVQYLDTAGNILSPAGDGLIHVVKGAQIRARLIATSPGNNVGRLYWRLQKPGNAGGAAPSSQWGWSGWGWGGETGVSGNTTWTSDPFTLQETGVWDFWHHAQSAGAGSIPPDGNSGGWATVHQPDIQVHNNPPSVTLTVNGVSSPGGSTNALTVSNGTTVTIATSGSDADGDYQRTRIWARFNGGAWTEIRNVLSATDSFAYTVNGVGTWEFHCRAMDNDGVESSTAVVNLTSTNRAPSASLSANLSSAAIGETVTLTLSVNDPDGNYDYANLWVATPNTGWRWIHADSSLASGGALDRNHSATAYGAAGTHTRTFSVPLGDGFGTYTFALAVVDSYGARTDSPNVTVSVSNRAPSGTFTIDGAGTGKTIVVGQSVALASTMTDLDGNLQNHSFWWDLGNNTYWANPWRDWSVPQNATGWSSLTGVGWLVSSGYNNSLSGVWTGYAPGTYSFHCAGGDGIDWVGNTLSGPSVLYINVIKASPSIAFPAIASANVGQAATLNASLSGAYNPSSGISYSIISTSGGAAGVINGAALNVTSLGDGNPGSITVRASYSGDGNNNSVSADQTLTVPNRAPIIVLTTNGVSSPGGSANSITVTDGATLSLTTSASDLDGNYQRTRVWAKFGDGVWTEIHNTTGTGASFQYTLNGVGTWEIHSRSLDNSGVESSTAIIAVTCAARPPETISASANNILLGQAVTLNGRATDPAGGLQKIKFYIHGTDMEGRVLPAPFDQWWVDVGDVTVSGADATAQIQFIPFLPGNYAVHIRAQNTYGLWDANANVVAAFTVREPVIAPPPSPQYISPYTELTLAHVNDTINGNVSGEYDESFYWTGTGWSSLGYVDSFTATSPGLYSAGGMYVFVLHPPTRPTAIISADKYQLYVGETSTISATFSPGQYDTMTNTNIDSPEGTGLLDWNTPTNKIYQFTPTSPGNYLFYARIGTVCFGVSTYSAINIHVYSRRPNVVSVSGHDIDLGKSATFNIRATDLDGDLQWLDLYAREQGAPGWIRVKRQGISGSDVTVSVSWLPLNAGNWEVRANALDKTSWQDTDNRTFAFVVRAFDTDSDGDGIPDAVENALGRDPKVPETTPSSKVKSYDYDKLDQLKTAPEGEFKSDKESNINVQNP